MISIPSISENQATEDVCSAPMVGPFDLACSAELGRAPAVPHSSLGLASFQEPGTAAGIFLGAVKLKEGSLHVSVSWMHGARHSFSFTSSTPEIDMARIFRAS